MSVSPQAPAAVLQALYDAQYQDAFQQTLESVAAALRDAGLHVAGPSDDTVDDYRWTLTCWPDDRKVNEQAVSVQITLAEAVTYGDDETPYGMSFALDALSWGGTVIAALQPHNYTDQCWVDARDQDAVDTRWSPFEEMDMPTLVNLISRSANPGGQS